MVRLVLSKKFIPRKLPFDNTCRLRYIVSTIQAGIREFTMYQMYDPPSGWCYGFPKAYQPLKGESLEETLLRDGYPQEKICEKTLSRVRFWESRICPVETKQGSPSRLAEDAGVSASLSAGRERKGQRMTDQEYCKRLRESVTYHQRRAAKLGGLTSKSLDNYRLFYYHLHQARALLAEAEYLERKTRP